jgi:flagellar biosynthesis/type III secretory pathway chaperone
MINRLIDILGREAALFESFLELLEEQKRLLVANDAEGVARVAERLRERIIESQLLNQKRESVVEEVKRGNRIEGDVTVSRLLEFADEDQVSRLEQLRDLIIDLNERITRARNTNAMLLNQSREFIAKTMAMLSRIKNPDHTYASDGAASPAGSNVVVDRRV